MENKDRIIYTMDNETPSKKVYHQAMVAATLKIRRFSLRKFPHEAIRGCGKRIYGRRLMAQPDAL